MTVAARRTTGPRLVLALGVVLGVAYLATLLLVRPETVGMNFQVYHTAARAALAGEAFYAVSPSAHPSMQYLYPPVTVVAFYPYAVFDSWLTGYVVHTLLKLAVAAWLARTLVRFVASSGLSTTRVDGALIGGYVLLSVHSVPNLVYGQVNLLLAAALAAGFLGTERGREVSGGVALGLAALVKLFPALVGVWLVRRRAWRAIAAAVATGGGLLLAGVALFGTSVHASYVRDVLLDRSAATTFAGGPDPAATYVTLRRPLAALFPALDSTALLALSVAFLAAVVVYLYDDVSGPVDRLVAVHGTVTAALLVVPSLLVYVVLLYFPLVPLLYFIDGRVARPLFLAGAAVASLKFTYAPALAAVAAAPLSAGTAATLRSALTTAFAFGTPTLYGLLAMLAGCVAYRWSH